MYSIIVIKFLLLILFQFNLSTATKSLISKVDLRINQFARHHTEKFYSAGYVNNSSATSDVIIRRGVDFKFNVFVKKGDVDHRIAAKVEYVTKSGVIIYLLNADETDGWSLTQTRSNTRIKVTVKIPGNAPVGVWKLTLHLLKKNVLLQTYEIPNRIIVLFNPWSSQDEAHFPSQEQLEEYVLNDLGITYHPGNGKPAGSYWIHGQFQPGVLDAIFFVLSQSELSPTEHGDIILVTRELTKLMNYDWRFERGVLEGKWSGSVQSYLQFDGRPAVPPEYWTGSPAIFHRFMEDGGKPVGYAQCWVYASVLTTAYRALGIASRVVSNFASAHSPRRDLTIKIHLNEQGTGIAYEEKLWNYHAWSQAWMKRTDVGTKFTGWQELDATPQERIDGRYQVGPVPNIAIRESELKDHSQAAFVYEEMNADQVVYSHDKRIVRVITDSVGKLILTKAVNSLNAEDITILYKPREGTVEERESYKKAAKSLGISPPSLNIFSPRGPRDEVKIDVQPKTDLVVGYPVSLIATIRKPESIKGNLQVTINATAMNNDGSDGEVLKNRTQLLSFDGTNSATITLNIKPKEYYEKLRDPNTIKVTVTAKLNKKVVAFEMKLFTLKTLPINVTAPETVNVNEEFVLNVQITNPYNWTLKDGKLAYEGSHVNRTDISIPAIEALSTKTESISLTINSAGKEAIVFHFKSGNLKMEASIQLEVIGQKMYRFASYSLHSETEMEEGNLADSPQPVNVTVDDFKCCDIENVSTLDSDNVV